MESRILEIQYLRKKGLLTEQQKDNDSVVKKSLLDIGVILDGTFTFGTGITAFLPIVRDLINLEQPQITEQSIILIYITAIWVILNRHQDKVKKLLQIIREQGLSDAFNRIVDFLKSLEDVVLKVADEVGYAASSIADVGAFTFLAFPLLDGLVALINNGEISLGEPSGYLKSVLISIGILSVKNIFNSIIKRIKTKFGTLEESHLIMNYNDSGISNDVFQVIQKTLFTEAEQLWILPHDINTTNQYQFNGRSHEVELTISRNVKLKEDYAIDIREGKSNNFKISLEINPIAEPNVYRNIKLTLKECFGRFGYSPINLTLSEQSSNVKVKTVFDNDEYKIVVPLDMESFCELSKDTRWCKTFSVAGYKGTFYIIYDKKSNSKTLVHDTGRIFLLREPNSKGAQYNVYNESSATSTWMSEQMRRFASDSPTLIDFFNLSYTPNDLIKFGMPIGDDLLKDYSSTNDFAQAVYKIIKEGNRLTNLQQFDILEPYLGDVAQFYDEYGSNRDTGFFFGVEVEENGVELIFSEETYENEILNLGEDGDEWYYSMAMGSGTYHDHDYLEDEELDYLCNFLNGTQVKRLLNILMTMNPNGEYDMENVCDDGVLQDELQKYFSTEWNNSGDEILWELSQGLGEYRTASLRESIQNDLTLIADDGGRSGYDLELSYSQLLGLIHQYKLKNFSDLLDSGFNEITFNLYEAWYDEWGYVDGTVEEVQKLMDHFLDKIEGDKETDLTNRRIAFDKWDKILRDLQFKFDSQLPSGGKWIRTIPFGDEMENQHIKLYAMVHKFNPDDLTVTLVTSPEPIRHWRNSDKEQEYRVSIDELSDYVLSPDLFSEILPEPEEASKL